jgi:hypothetical protein
MKAHEGLATGQGFGCLLLSSSSVLSLQGSEARQREIARVSPNWIAMTDQGEVVTWRGQGVGRFTGHGMAVSWRGAIYYQTTSERLARLNGIAAVFEYEADESGKTADKTYEWK